MSHQNLLLEDLHFVKLGVQYIKELVEIEKICFTMPWSEKDFASAFKQDVFHVFAFMHNEEIIAYASIYMHSFEFEILNIAVMPKYRSLRLGNKLLSKVLIIVEEFGIMSGVLEVRPSNFVAIRLYESFGFKEVGKRPKYYADTGEDALVFRLDKD